MSLHASMLWVVGLVFTAWGVWFILRIVRRMRRPQSNHPQWALLAFGLSVTSLGLALCKTGAVAHELDPAPESTSQTYTAWWIAAASLAALATLGLISWALGDRAKGRLRCPKCWHACPAIGTAINTEANTSQPTSESIDSNAASCPNCERQIEDDQELVRTRRNRWQLVSALALLGLGVFGVFRFDADFRPAELVPAQALLRLHTADGPSPNWVADEVKARTAYRLGQQSSFPFMLGQARFKHLLSGGSPFHDLEDREAYRYGYSLERPDGSFPFQREEIAAAWVTGSTEILRRVLADDPAAVKQAHRALDPFRFMFMLALMQQPDYDESADHNSLPEPACFFPEPDLTESEWAEIESVALTDESRVQVVTELLGWRLYDRFRGTMLEIWHDPATSLGHRNRIAKVIADTINHSESARADFVGWLESSNTAQHELALKVLRWQGLLTDRFQHYPPETLMLVQRLLREPGELPRDGIAHVLLGFAGDRPDALDPWLELALQDPNEAALLIDTLNRGSSRLGVRDAAFAQLAESPDRAIRLQIANSEQPYIDLSGRMDEILAQLEQDAVPEIAAAARAARRDLEPGP